MPKDTLREYYKNYLIFGKWYLFDGIKKKAKTFFLTGTIFNFFSKAYISKILKSPYLDNQIDRNFEHIGLDNAVISSHRNVDQINRFIKNRDINILIVGCCEMYEYYTFKSYGYNNIAMIDLVSRNSLVRVMDMHRMRFPDESFDLVYMAGVFQCTHDPQKLVQETLRVLKKTGFVLIDVVVGFPKNNVYRYDVESVSNIHKLFGPYFEKDYFSEELLPGNEFNPHGNKLVRTLFGINKRLD